MWIQADCSEDTAGAEVTLAVTATANATAAAASTSDLMAGWTMKQVGEWKDRNPGLTLRQENWGI